MSLLAAGELEIEQAPTPAAGETSFWRKEEPVLDPVNNAVLKGGMWLHQRRWWELPTFIKALVAGYGSGKTQIGAKRIIALALQNAPIPVGAVSPTFAMARRTSITALQMLLDGKERLLGRRRFRWHYHGLNNAFYINYHGRRATIGILSGDNPLSLRGDNLAAAWIDEAFLQDQAVFDAMIARVRAPGARHREINLTCTPEQLNWGYDLCIGDLKQKLDVGIVQASTRQNLALPASYVRNLEASLTAKAAQAYIEGEFVNLSEGLVYYAFDPAENVVDLPVPMEAELGVGMDFNNNPMAAAVFWRLGDRMHFFHEIELPNSDTDSMCITLRERFGQRLVMVYPDASGALAHTNSGKSDFQTIKGHGFEIEAPRANPLRKDRFNAVNGKFRAKDGRVTLTIAPACVRLRRYLQAYAHEIINTDAQKALSHLCDAMSYPVAHLFGLHRPTVGVHKLRGF